MLNKIRQHIYAERVNGKKYLMGGLKKQEYKEKDIKYGGILGYTPKHQVKVIATYSTKSQHNNTCTQEAGTLQAEVREKMELSEQSLTILTKERGEMSGDGFSTLTAILETKRNLGVAEKKYAQDLEENIGWTNYSNPQRLSAEGRENAKIHKSSDYYRCIGRNARLEALDNDMALLTGLDWHSGWNMAGGFSAPFIVKRYNGSFIGGHALTIIGYDLPRSVYIIKNSLGEDWGGYVDSTGVKHPGCFAIDMLFFDSVGHAAYAENDLTENKLEEILKQYEGQQVKGSKPAIYFVSEGKKRSFGDTITFYCFGGRYGADGKTYMDVAQNLLDMIPEGEPMKIEDSPFFDKIRDDLPVINKLSDPNNLEALKKVLKEKGLEEPAGNFIQNLFLKLTNMKGKYGVFSSSADTEKLSLTVKGILLSLVPILLMLLSNKGYNVNADDLNGFINLIFTIIGGIMTAYGLIRKIFTKK